MASSLRLPPFWFLGPNSPRLSSVEWTGEVESEIYGDEFSVCIGTVNRLSRVCRMVALVRKLNKHGQALSEVSVQGLALYKV
jgi:hypothetical protein